MIWTQSAHTELRAESAESVTEGGNGLGLPRSLPLTTCTGVNGSEWHQRRKDSLPHQSAR
jgi:hypothetical protein